jgi:hypothetical protein
VDWVCRLLQTLDWLTQAAWVSFVKTNSLWFLTFSTPSTWLHFSWHLFCSVFRVLCSFISHSLCYPLVSCVRLLDGCSIIPLASQVRPLSRLLVLLVRDCYGLVCFGVD